MTQQILTTDRLVIRELDGRDIDALYAIFSHPEVMRYWASPPWTSITQAEGRLARAQEGYRSEEDFQWGIERKADGALLGTCSLFSFNRPSRRCEIGYALGRPYWGQGYMGEALQALVAYAFDTLDLNRLEADIDPRNNASARTLERLGFQKEGFMPERWIVVDEVSDTQWYGLLRRNWQGAK
ncbi:MAG: GNAT family N-acetyltransferase [Caldilineaceae bacterium]|nr:GNAT family N-acetyltransferase [Caldilineaceae bacterium]